VQYRSKLGLDYKQSLPRKPRKQHHYGLLAATSLIVLTIMGAVVANVSTLEDKSTVATAPQVPSTDTILLPLEVKQSQVTQNKIKYTASINTKSTSTLPLEPAKELASQETNETGQPTSQSTVETITKLPSQPARAL